MTGAALSFRGVVKGFRAWPRRTVHRALDDLSFAVPTGSICALVGPNGAGKTTAFSVICGFLSADEGEVDILGEGPFDPGRHKGRVGVLPQDAELSDRHTPRELLVHLARLQGLTGEAAASDAERVLRVVRLDERMDHRIATLSHGMRRRVAVASALVGDPELVLLDEPTAGLDPVESHALRDALAKVRGAQTLVISSHNLAELELLCDHVIVMSNGRCVRQGTVADVTGRLTVVEWVLTPGAVPLDALRRRLPGHELAVDGEVLRHQVPAGEDLDEAALTVMEELVAARLAVREMRRGVSLERRFIAETSMTRAS